MTSHSKAAAAADQSLYSLHTAIDSLYHFPCSVLTLSSETDTPLHKLDVTATGVSRASCVVTRRKYDQTTARVHLH